MSSSVDTESPLRFSRHETSHGHLLSQLISDDQKVFLNFSKIIAAILPIGGN